MFIDTHSHLDLCKDPETLIKNAKERNTLIITCGVNPESNKKTLEYLRDNVKVALGMYPVDALKLTDKEIDSEIKFIKENKEKVSAIGEVGLDLKNADNLERQKEILTKFVLLAKELNVPLTIHSRKAEKETINLLKEIGYSKIIMHCFSGKLKLVQEIIDNNWYFSIPTNVKHSEHFQKVIELAPIEQLFCETDSPYLHPDKERNNEPMNVVESYKKIAEIKNISLEEVESKIEENFKKLF